MTPVEQDHIVLAAYANAADLKMRMIGDDRVSVYEVIAGITRVCENLNISQAVRPSESRREKATTRLRKSGMIERAGSICGTPQWRVTDYGHEHLAYLSGAVAV